MKMAKDVCIASVEQLLLRPSLGFGSLSVHLMELTVLRVGEQAFPAEGLHLQRS